MSEYPTRSFITDKNLEEAINQYRFSQERPPSYSKAIRDLLVFALQEKGYPPPRE